MVYTSNMFVACLTGELVCEPACVAFDSVCTQHENNTRGDRTQSLALRCSRARIFISTKVPQLPPRSVTNCWAAITEDFPSACR